ncbi:MAG: hypothetical protein AB8B87_21320 [Granulosicoccus sp.]
MAFALLAGFAAVLPDAALLVATFLPAVPPAAAFFATAFFETVFLEAVFLEAVFFATFLALSFFFVVVELDAVFLAAVLLAAGFLSSESVKSAFSTATVLLAVFSSQQWLDQPVWVRSFRTPPKPGLRSWFFLTSYFRHMDPLWIKKLAAGVLPEKSPLGNQNLML